MCLKSFQKKTIKNNFKLSKEKEKERKMARTKNGLNKDDRSPIEIFVDAIQKNDIKKVEQMIKEGININEAYNVNNSLS